MNEATKQKRLGEGFKCFSYPWYAWHFQTQVPPEERLTDAECRLAWHRDMLDESIEKCTRKVMNRKTGKAEEVECMFIDVGAEIRKEQIQAEKRITSVIVAKNNANQKAIERSKQQALNFLSMSADDAFFQAARWHAATLLLLPALPIVIDLTTVISYQFYHIVSYCHQSSIVN